MADTKKTKPCPHCRETIHADALKCRYCKTLLYQDQPAHSGTCPLCREKIDALALRCHHCESDVSVRPPVLVGVAAPTGRRTTVQGAPFGTMPGNMPDPETLFALAPGAGDAPGDSPIFGRTRCVMVPIPVCTWIEEPSPVAGYLPPVLQECHWEWRKICFWSPI